MPNLFKGIRWKIVWLFFLSVMLALVSLSAVVLILFFLHDLRLLPFTSFFKALYYMVGLPILLSVTGVFFFIFYVVLLSHRSIRYLVQITAVVKQLSQGNFDRQIPVQTNDELGQLADNINRMAQQLKRSIEEERLAVQAKNELVTNVSHDLRTPLTSIIGYLQLIEHDRYQDEVELRYYVSIAYEKSQRLGRMVNDLFDYTRMTYGQQVLKPIEINLIELLGQLIAEFSLQLEDAEMSIHLSVAEEKILISADGDKLMRAFENLISNAIKYGKEGKQVNVVGRKEGHWAIVQVINYGEPIPAVYLPHIFERFYRVEKSRSVETGGTGLGLAIVKSIIDLHQGKITVTSDQAATCFEVTLPITTEIKA